MIKLRRTISIFMLAVLLTCWNAPCFASDNAFKDLFENSLYGGLAGGLVGAALLAFTKRPGNHLDYMIYGAAGGVLVGAAYGLTKSAKSLAELENGKVRFAIPTIIPDIQESNSKGQTALILNAELIRGTF